MLFVEKTLAKRSMRLDHSFYPLLDIRLALSKLAESTLQCLLPLPQYVVRNDHSGVCCDVSCYSNKVYVLLGSQSYIKWALSYV